MVQSSSLCAAERQSFFAMVVSEYEAKRLRRIEENRRKLQALNLPVIGDPSGPKPDPKPKKRERIYEETPVPTRMSTRQRKKMKKEAVTDDELLKQYRRERRRLTKVTIENVKRRNRQKYRDKKLQKQVLEEERTKRVEEQLKQLDEAAEKEPRIKDWRLRRRRQAQLERRKESVVKKEKLKDERKLAREKKKAIRKIWRASELLHKKRRKKRERDAMLLQKEIEKQQRWEERQLMAAEDHVARKWEKKQKRDEKDRPRHERNIFRGLIVEELAVERKLLRSKVKEDKEEALFKKTYPVSRVKALPFVRISDARNIDEAKPLVMTPLLKVDSNFFHGFSLGKQFLPPGKGSVMQGVCPGGYTAAYNEELDIHVWKNAMTLFMNCSSGIYYHFKFEEEVHDGRTSVFLRWSHTCNVTPEILERLRRLQKGDENLCFDDETYYDAPTPTDTKPEPLLLFVQYPLGPYIYLGRLGYLGHRSDPLEFSFQMLDVNALNWKKIRKVLTCEIT
ncbi:hypothetical protein V7S43_007191 [Phytophthora oleae]|uniref:Uncharacterized protein n=1 Tax=Phytophthora oleae TaxID=2107226 RepID=A0ABD3FL56_9STRA